MSSLLKERGIDLEFRNGDTSKKQWLVPLLDECKPDCVLILADNDPQNPEAEDERIVRTLLYLREYRAQEGAGFSITSEMLLTQNKELAAAIEPDDFIVSRQFSALIMAQISQKRPMAQLFEQILSSDGFEVYMKPAMRYVPQDEPIDVVSASEAVAGKDEVFIGIRQKIGDIYRQVEINPSKYVSDMQTLRQYTFGKDDYFVVLAEDNRL